MSVPRLVIAGLSSGVGKTTATVALARALRTRGRRVAVFKIGPDYLDPGYLARAAGVPCHNLDGWMMGRTAVLATLARGAAGADVALIEGMMGLYDGVAPDSDEGSAAELAKWIGAPVLAVVDASGLARSIAAVGLGLRALDENVRLAGLVANRVGSRGHLDLLRRACAHAKAPPIVGGLPEERSLAFPERHLGLQLAESIPDSQIEAWSQLAADWIDLDAVLELARSAPSLPAGPPPPAPRPIRCRIAVARDAAFHFYYEDNLRRLEALGAELVPFSPLTDAAVPAADGLYLGGGYPEVHAAALAANRPMRASVRAFAGPIYAECGGLMYLTDAIRTLDGVTHPMVGRVRGTAVLQPRLVSIGYVEVETQRPTLIGDAGVRFRGHQFRHSTLEGAPSGDAPAYRVSYRWGGAAEPEGWSDERVLASWVHAHWASNPGAAAAFVDRCVHG